MDEIEQDYKDENGAYFFAANDTPILITRTRTISDNTTLSGNGTLVGALARLYYLAGAERYHALADNIVRTFAGEPTPLDIDQFERFTSARATNCHHRRPRRRGDPIAGRLCLQPFFAGSNIKCCRHTG